jgi:lactate dehydrogenase-like 2-hydroxyacid dehydrogenase
MVMKKRVLQHGRLTPGFEAQLAAEFDLCPLWQQANPADYLAIHGKEFVGLVTSGVVGADAAMLDAMPALQVIANRGVGCDKIDLDAARRRGIVVSNTPGVLTDCVADLAIGALIAVARKLCVADRFVRQGEWLNRVFPLTTKVSGKKLGIVGMGRIGRAIAQRADGFAMEIRYHSRTELSDLPWSYEPLLPALARWADFLVVSAPGGPQTRHLISAEVIAALGPSSFLINVSRGSLVDESALTEALVAGQIAGAALDVFKKEPKVPERLLALENVVLLPHIASGTIETFAAMENLVLENLRSFFSCGRLLTPVI